MKITAEVSNLNKEEMNAYEADLKYRRDWKNAMDFAVQEAVEKAVEETKEETSRRKQLEIAKNFKQAGVDADIIAQSTGLTIDEINAL
jgi:predicted transposase/invertase (TIGR01784 family)